MKKFIITSVIVILSSLSIVLLLKNHQLSSQLKEKEYVTKVIKSPTPIEIPKPYGIEVPPSIITLYPLDVVNVPYKEVKTIKDTIRLYNSEDSLDINKQYLLQYPEASKLLYFDLTSKELQLSLLDINGNIHKDDYCLDLYNYNYRLSNNKLTSEKIGFFKKIRPELSYTIRPLINFHDLNLSLKLDTKNFTYRFGINSYYYPKLSGNDKFGITPLFNISYRF